LTGWRVDTWLDEQFSSHGWFLSVQLFLFRSLVMPNDAKLGLIVGVGIVLAVAVVFFRKEGDASSLEGETAAAAVGTAKTGTGSPPSASSRSIKAKPTGQMEDAPVTAQPTSRRPFVEEGENGP
jgi:hypothetical protein